MDDARRARLRRHLALIDDGVAPVAERYAAHMQCGPGCDDCCHQTFRVSGLEGELLREGLQELTAEVRDDIVDRASRYQPDQRDRCPVLGEDGRCRLYAYRPRICRKYGIPLWHPDRPEQVRCCSLNFRDVPDIDPTLILDPQAGWAEDWIRTAQALGEGKGESRTIAELLREEGTDPAAAVR